MSLTGTNDVLRPKNPTLSKHNVPKAKGKTRVLPDGSLLYREPITNTEVPAVRLEEIRPRLVEEASKKMSYRFPKKRGYEDTNVTAFVKKDYNYGPKRENRPDRLFQITSTGAKREKPDGYVQDGGRIVLDAFDHGLRNFGNQLPMYVSSELAGHDIEDYLRRNRKISVYDLVARAPNGYYEGPPKSKSKKNKQKSRTLKWHVGPPRVGTFSMRATRFRLRAGCLSWGKKDGTKDKNDRILDLIPAQYKDPSVNSTKGWRDLDRKEKEQIDGGAKKKPQLGRKAKQVTQAAKEEEKKEVCSGDSAAREEISDDDDKMQYDNKDKDVWEDLSKDQESVIWPAYDQEDFNSSTPPPETRHVNPKRNNTRQPSSIMVNSPVNEDYEPFQQSSLKPRKRSRAALSAEFEESSDDQAQKRARTETVPQISGRASRVTTSRSARQQRQPIPASYHADGASRAFTYPMFGSNNHGPGPHDMLFGDTSSSSPSIFSSDRKKISSSSSVGSSVAQSPILHNSNTQYGSIGSSFEAPLDYNTSQLQAPNQNLSNGYVQPDLPPFNQSNSNSFDPLHFGSGMNSEFNMQDNWGECYAPGMGSYNIGSSNHASPQPNSQYIPSLSYNGASNSFTPDQSKNTQLPFQYPQHLHPSTEASGKRKRNTPSNPTDQPDGQPSSKRTKGHIPNQTSAPQASCPIDPALGANYPYLTPSPSFDSFTSTPDFNGDQMNTYTTFTPQAAGYAHSSLPEVYPFSHEDSSWTDEQLQDTFQAQPAMEMPEYWGQVYPNNI